MSLLRSMSSSRRESEAGGEVSSPWTSCAKGEKSVSQSGGGGGGGGGGEPRWGAAPMLGRGSNLKSCVSLGLTVALIWLPGMGPGLGTGSRAGAGSGSGAALTTPSASGVASSQNWNFGG